MAIYIHPTLISKPFSELQAVLDDIGAKTGLVDSVSNRGAMLVYPETVFRCDSLSPENASRLKNYQRKHAARKQNKSIQFHAEIF